MGGRGSTDFLRSQAACYIVSWSLPTEETQVRFSATESTNKTLVSELQELQKRLTEAEEQARAAERQKAHFQRLLQENKKRLAPLQLEIQRIIEKVPGHPRSLGNTLGGFIRRSSEGV